MATKKHVWCPLYTQEINYRAVMKAIAGTGFTGYIGHEFMPTRDPREGLCQAINVCNV